MDHPTTILVVDDEPELRELSAVFLRKAGYHVVLAGTGAEGLELVEHHAPHMVLLDVVLPDIDGFEVCRRIKANPRLVDVFVVLVSGLRVSADDTVTGLTAGSDGYIPRPLPMREFLARVQSLLRIRATQQALRESEERFRSMFDKAPLAYQSLSSSGQIIDVNQTWLDQLGYQRDQVVGQDFGELVLARSQGWREDCFGQFLETGVIQDQILELRHRDGSTFLASFDGRVTTGSDGAVTHTHCVFRDVTRTIRANERVEVLLATLRAIREVDLLVVEERDVQRLLSGVSEIVASVPGLDVAMLIALDPSGTPTCMASAGFDPEVAPTLDSLRRSPPPCLAHAITSPESPGRLCTSDYRHHCGIWLASPEIEERRCVPLRHKSRLLGVLTVGSATRRVHDPELDGLFAQLADDVALGLHLILEEALRERAEARLRQSEAEFRSLFEFAPVGLAVISAEGTVAACNEYVSRMLGRSQARLSGESPAELLAEQAEWRELDDEITTTGSIQHRELTLRRSTGERFPAALSATRIGDQGTTLVVVEDLTEEHRTAAALMDTELQLRQSQKLKAIGRLAGGVAHDFNNLLSVILTNCDFLSEDLREGDPLRAEVTEVVEAAERAASLTRQLLAFGRRQVLQPRNLDLNQVVSNLTKMLRRLVGEHIQMELGLEPALGTVFADPGQVEQVLMNLAVNAAHAMPDGGKLVIETSNVELDDAYAATHTGVQPGRYAMLAVSDNGTGMDSEVLGRVFEPFFTTKERGEGSGLGLSTVYGIVKQSGGNVWAYSEPGVGTTFRVYLPQRDQEARDPAPLRRVPETNDGTELVLVVEDEAPVRALAVSILRRRGYQVLVAEGPEEALAICRGVPDLDLLVTDVVMPVRSGVELAAEARTLRPDLKVLFMSGYAEDAIIHHGVLSAEMHFLAKPFTAQTMARMVRQVLDS